MEKVHGHESQNNLYLEILRWPCETSEKLEVYEQKKNGSAKQISLESFVKKRNEASLGCVGECWETGGWSISKSDLIFPGCIKPEHVLFMSVLGNVVSFYVWYESDMKEKCSQAGTGQ